MSTILREPDDATGKSTPTITNLQQRWITALVFGPLVLLMVVLGGWWFFALALTLTIIGTLEFCHLGRNRRIEAASPIALSGVVVVLLGAAFDQTSWMIAAFIVVAVLALAWALIRRREPRLVLLDTVMTVAAPLYVGMAGALLIIVRAAPDGLIWLLLVLFLTWGTDTLAYFGGRAWGKTLLAPRISPKKTVEGALTGMIGGATTGAILLALTGKLTLALVPLLLCAPIVAVVGDLSESALKRLFDVKDSHLSHFNLFPGHGGVLDRTDALILVTWFCYGAYVLLGIVT
jgi:phosphatidate cytidylyltransferase